LFLRGCWQITLSSIPLRASEAIGFDTRWARGGHVEAIYSLSDLPLFSEDLDHCQKVFDIVREELSIARGSEKEEVIAASIIHFYKPGARDETQLLILARTAAIS
jgi:hypothetical protein